MPLSTDLHNSIILHDSTTSIGKSDRCWFDSHCHFDFDVFDKNRDEQWLLLKEYGCAGLIIPGVTAKQWPRLISLCADKPWGYSLGLHPYFIEQHQEGDLNKLDNACAEQLELPAEESNLVAVGEFGLDFMLASSGHTQQVELCRQQLLIAKKYNLPVILHIRKAYDEVAAMIRSIGFTEGGIVHAFSGSYQQGMVFIGLGFKLGIGGAMSHSRANKLRATITRLPLDGLVLETDAPDMLPAFWQGPHNSPLSILFLAQIVASLHRCDLNQVLLSSNRNLLGILPKFKH
ncbi:MAG TPA: hypothetical protein DIC30_06955 [Oceanospirillales bacterium]|nr:hypothetical protein [Oceanospirillales bacterium]|tara:strand:+ start:2610 stop:3476 length:867 start_codon:yes stop_codon:yes gene_type:complete